MKELLKEWRTTIVGAVGAGVIAILPILQTGEVSWRSIDTAFTFAALGYFSKDKSTKQ